MLPVTPFATDDQPQFLRAARRERRRRRIAADCAPSVHARLRTLGRGAPALTAAAEGAASEPPQPAGP